MAGELEGRVVVLIGGTTGMGLSAARACVVAGAKVVALGRDDKNELAAARAQLGEAAMVMGGDAVDPSVAPRAIETAVREYGGFHALYHVAGGSGRRFGDGPLHELTDDGWRLTVDLNQASVFYSNRAAVHQFLAQKSGGSILNMGSVLSISPSPRYFASHAYAATKAAIIGLSRSCASYYASQGIRFNVIAPGLVLTPMASRAAEDPAIMEFIRTKQPLDGGRIGRPEDLDAAVVYLLSDASRFVTGQVLCIDGGWCLSDGQIPG